MQQLTSFLLSELEDSKPDVETADVEVKLLPNKLTALPESRLLASYVDSAEEWKCMYRLDIATQKDKLKSDKVHEEGKKSKTDDGAGVALSIYGRVKNTTAEDWCNIELALVANELEMLKRVRISHSPVVVN